MEEQYKRSVIGDKRRRPEFRYTLKPGKSLTDHRTKKVYTDNKEIVEQLAPILVGKLRSATEGKLHGSAV